jgi:hypothetical protein
MCLSMSTLKKMQARPPILIPTLQAEGHEVIAAQYGLDTLADDVAAVKSTLARLSTPAILVGHSYGGTPITARWD